MWRAVALVSLLAFWLPSGLGEEGDCFTTGAPEGDATAADRRFYVDTHLQDPRVYSNVAAVFIFEESNGHPGLQRGDSWTNNLYECGGEVAPDTLVASFVSPPH